MLNITSVSFFIFIGHLVFAVTKDVPPDKATVDVLGIGKVLVAHRDLGEPLAAPEEVRISVKCTKSRSTKELALFRLCKYGGYEYERGVKTLTLKLISARVIQNSGLVVCDQVDQKQIDLSKVCD